MTRENWSYCQTSQFESSKSLQLTPSLFLSSRDFICILFLCYSSIKDLFRQTLNLDRSIVLYDSYDMISNNAISVLFSNLGRTLSIENSKLCTKPFCEKIIIDASENCLSGVYPTDIRPLLLRDTSKFMQKITGSLLESLSRLTTFWLVPSQNYQCYDGPLKCPSVRPTHSVSHAFGSQCHSVRYVKGRSH